MPLFRNYQSALTLHCCCIVCLLWIRHIACRASAKFVCCTVTTCGRHIKSSPATARNDAAAGRAQAGQADCGAPQSTDGTQDHGADQGASQGADCANAIW